MSPGLNLIGFNLHLRLRMEPKDWGQAKRVLPKSRYSLIHVPRQRPKKVARVRRGRWNG